MYLPEGACNTDMPTQRLPAVKISKDFTLCIVKSRSSVCFCLENDATRSCGKVITTSHRSLCDRIIELCLQTVWGGAHCFNVNYPVQCCLLSTNNYCSLSVLHSRINLSGSVVNSFRVPNLTLLADIGLFDPVLLNNQCKL